MIKKLISLLISICLMGGMCVNVSAVGYGEELKNAPVKTYVQKFSDVPESYWAFSYISEMTERGVLSGYPDGKFYPDAQVSRAEFAKIMTTAAGLSVTEPITQLFADVQISEWYAPYVHTAKDYLSAYSQGGASYYLPNTPAPREDIAVALVKLKGYSTTGADLTTLQRMFSDYQSISENAKIYVAAAIENGLISGYSDGTFKGQSSITRAEAATLLWRAYQYGNSRYEDSTVNNENNKKTGRKIKSIAHQSYAKDFPQNNLELYKIAVNDGFIYLEGDVSFTSDLVPVLLHDQTINAVARKIYGQELTEDIYINEITYNETLAYDFGIYKGLQFAGTKILPLDEFLKFCKDNNVKPYIELKTQSSKALTSSEQVSAVLSLVEKYKMEKDVTVTSFNYNLLRLVSMANDSIRLGYLKSNVKKEDIEICKMLKTNNNEVFMNSKSYTSDEIALCKEADIPLEVWTINKIDEILSLDPYISGVTSDYYNAESIFDNKNANWENVRVISAEELTNNYCINNLATPYGYSKAGRISYTDFNLFVEQGYEYKVEFLSTTPNAKVSMILYNEEAFKLIEENKKTYYTDSNWKESGYSFRVISRPNGYEYKNFRLQFMDSAGIEKENFITSVTIKRRKIQ